ncbi:TonB-dependent receptor domain-containing protein [Marinobacterium jannaschii]|uniref:TonB-dependent receptor domain-containing protein n=1 Tax=Marinobacterium jannaschii TaxID=64970 RepID=UPI000481D63F|nr:TonB-dependent receptor [Marinobacterium jannaschii]
MSSLPRRQLLSIAIAAATSSLSLSAAAETQETIKVVGHDSALVDSLIDQETLENYQAADLEDIFRGEPSVSVGGSLGVAQKIYVRGIEDTNLNISIDGAVQAGYLFHHQGRVSIEPELLKQVEVQTGAGLATDGPGALGGAIRFETKDPEDLLKENEQFGALVKLGYHSNNQGLKGSTSLFGRLSDDVSVMASVVRYDADNFESGNGTEQANTEIDQTNGFFKIVGNVADNQTLRLSHERRYDDGTRNLRPHFGAFSWNATNDQESHRKTTTLQYDIDPAGDALDIEATLYHTDNYLTQNRSGDFSGAGVKSTGTDIRNTLRSDDHTLVTGIDYREDSGYFINPETPTRDDEARVAGLYIQDHYQATDQLLLTAGARYDHYELTDTENKEFEAKGLSPNVGARYQLTENLELHASYAEALRGQKVKEAYMIGWATNRDGLQEETADNYEVGFDYQSGNFGLKSTVFVGHIYDYVDRVTRQEIDNSGDVKTKGFDIRASYDWELTTAALSFSRIRPEIDGKPLDDGDMGAGTSIGDTLTAEVSHQLPRYDLELGWTGRFVKRLESIASAGRAEKAGYGVSDVYAKWLPTGNPDLSLTLTVKNLFDKQYLDHGSYGVSTDSGDTLGLPEAGRDFRLTAAYRF